MGNGTRDYGNDVEPARLCDWPAIYSDYQLLPESQSPDGRWGFIYPKRSLVEQMGSPPRLFLVQQTPFRMVMEIPIQGAILADNAHGSYQVNWSADSSAVVFIVGRKWGPEAVFAFLVRGGHPGRTVDLVAQVRKIVQPSYVQSHAPRFNDYYDFIFADEDFMRDTDNRPVAVTTNWTLTWDRKVSIKCICTTDPKHLSEKIWEAIFEGTWDIAANGFIDHKIEVIPRSRLL